MTAEAPRRSRWRPGLSRRWFLLPVTAALIVLIGVVALAPGPPRVDTEPAAPLVRVQVVAPEPVVPTLEGYGEIRAERSWQAVAQVRTFGGAHPGGGEILSRLAAQLALPPSTAFWRTFAARSPASTISRSWPRNRASACSAPPSPWPPSPSTAT